jgi:hypothetical protein
MSHFATIKTKLNNKDVLVQALKQALAEKGIILEILVIPKEKDKDKDEEKYIQVFAKAQRLINEYAPKDEKYCEIVISRKALRGENQRSLTDIGYRWNGQEYELEIDSYDFRTNRLGAAFNTVEDFIKTVQLQHDLIRLNETLENGYPESVWEYGEASILPNGAIRMEMTKKPELSINSWG